MPDQLSTTLEPSAGIMLPRYSSIVRSLHWVTALLILISYGLGLIMKEFPRGPSRNFLTMLHVSLGLLGVTLTIMLAMWRLMVPGPQPLAGSASMQHLAWFGHLALYAAMLAVPLLGLAMMWAKGRDVGVFGLFILPSPIAADRAWGSQIEELHEFSAHALLALAGLHAAAALLHQFVLRDHGMERMLPLSGPLRIPRA